MNRTENALCNDLAAKLTATGDGAPDLASKLQLVHAVQQMSSDAADAVFVEVLKAIDRYGRGLQRTSSLIADLRKKIDLLIGRLWYPAIFMGHAGDPAERHVFVQNGNTQRVVGVAEQVPVDSLAKGCEVMLNQEQSAVVAKSVRGFPRTGDIATVIEKTSRGSIILRNHEEEVEVESAAARRC